MEEARQEQQDELSCNDVATEIGAEIWNSLCRPAIQVAENNLTLDELGHLYAGITLSAWSDMVADFGEEHALCFARQMVSMFEQIVPVLAEECDLPMVPGGEVRMAEAFAELLREAKSW